MRQVFPGPSNVDIKEFCKQSDFDFKMWQKFVYISSNKGNHWLELTGNLPVSKSSTVSINEFELRSFWGYDLDDDNDQKLCSSKVKLIVTHPLF